MKGMYFDHSIHVFYSGCYFCSVRLRTLLQKTIHGVVQQYINPILASEGQICPTNPKRLNFGQKYNLFWKRRCDNS